MRQNKRGVNKIKGLLLIGLAAAAVTGCLKETPVSTPPGAFVQPFESGTLLKETYSTAGENQVLPSAYDSRREGRAPQVKNQQNLGTCWAFASLSALESSLLPEETWDFSEDHMSIQNSFCMGQNAGGDYIMSLAYLLAWQGPVTEGEDPYNDGISPDNLAPSKHVQEVQILPPGDRQAIKQAVLRTGGVQSSLYTSLKNSDSESVYYQKAEAAYYYDGQAEPNHDVVIVGWDDAYPKEKFTIMPPDDGAFLCVSSWGEAFGDGGYFYVSYYDANMGQTNLVYSRIDNPDNYDKIYQTDLCGWSGQAGYGSETAFGANIYQADEQELLCAAGFYATGPDTDYEIYGIRNPSADFADRKLLAKGTVKQAGYYTIDFANPMEIGSGDRFGVMIKITTRDSVQPMAIEYQADPGKGKVDITDGEGYLSYDGIHFQRTESSMGCNICLKAYARRIS